MPPEPGRTDDQWIARNDCLSSTSLFTQPAHGMERRNGLLVCYGRQVVTAETVQSIEEEDDAA